MNPKYTKEYNMKLTNAQDPQACIKLHRVFRKNSQVRLRTHHHQKVPFSSLIRESTCQRNVTSQHGTRSLIHAVATVSRTPQRRRNESNERPHRKNDACNKCHIIEHVHNEHSAPTRARFTSINIYLTCLRRGKPRGQEEDGGESRLATRKHRKPAHKQNRSP